jgi:hypothetical protein
MIQIAAFRRFLLYTKITEKKLIAARGIDCGWKKAQTNAVVTVVQCRLRTQAEHNMIWMAHPKSLSLIPEEVAKSIRMSLKVDPRRGC